MWGLEDKWIYSLGSCFSLGQSSVVELLLEKGASIDYSADINDGDRTQSTALIAAVCSRRRNIVEILLQEGADRNKKFREHSAFDMASGLKY
jgi:ankyrin repeat protein